MKYIPGHLKKNLAKWENKKWYHQRFDGSPYFLHVIGEAETKAEERKHGCHFNIHYCFFENGKADWYIEWEDIKRIYTKIIELGKENPLISEEMIDNWKKDDQLFYEWCAKVEKTDLSKLNAGELIRLHDQFVDIIVNRQTCSSLIDGFALGTDEIIAEKIKEVYEKSELKELRFTEVFSVLTAPVHLSFINEAEVEFLKLAVEVKKNPEKREKLLEEYQKNFFWTRNNYVDANVLTVEHFNLELDKVLHMKINLEEDIKKILDTPNRNKKRKEELMKKLTISAEIKLLIKVSEDFTYWQDIRKKSTFFTTHYFNLFLEEISKRVGIPTEELKYLSMREISKIFAEKPKREVLQERMKNSVFYWDTEGHECVYGKEADEVKQAVLGNLDLSDVDDFRGLTASMGKAIGKVKVLKSAKEIGKVEKGDIIVAVMTRPDYVPAMKKAAAIVTDEGGVTCHAAIISRELGVPCIIATKIATKVLKDGMVVEVNANHGWVRIVKD